MKVLARSLVVLALVGAVSLPVAGVGAAPGGSTHRQLDGVASPAAPTFGRTGTVVESYTETDLVTGVVLSQTRTEEYDTRGRLVHSLQVDTEDGVVVWRDESTYEYLADRAQRIVNVFDGDGDGPGPADTVVVDLVYDTHGVLVAADTTYDYGTDGTIDATDHESYTNNNRGRVLTSHVELGRDGLVIYTTYTYDQHGNVTGVTEDVDQLGTPQSPDQRYIGTSEYDKHGNLASAVDEYYDVTVAGDDVLTERYVYSSTYGKGGQRLADHDEADFDGDGFADAVRDTVYGYDNGRQTSSVSTTVEGALTTVETVLQSFDNRGNLLTYVRESETDGELTIREAETDTYDTRGRFTGFLYTVDENGDGQAEFVERQVVTSYDSRGRVTGFLTTEEDGVGTVLARHEVAIEWFKDYQIRTSLHDDDNDGTWDRKIVRVVPL